VVDTLGVFNVMGATKIACVQQSTTNDRVKDTVMQYLAAHPGTRDFAAAGEGLMALQAAFPCH
jgi:hypothetical protein